MCVPHTRASICRPKICVLLLSCGSSACFAFGICVTRLWHLQVEDLIHRAVDSIGFVQCLLPLHDRTVCQVKSLLVTIDACHQSAAPTGALVRCYCDGEVCVCPKRCGLLMQDAQHRLFVDVIIKAAMLITASLLKLGREELAIMTGATISGKIAQGCMDYLVTFQGLQVRIIGPSFIPPLYRRRMLCYVSGVAKQDSFSLHRWAWSSRWQRIGPSPHPRTKASCWRR